MAFLCFISTPSRRCDPRPDLRDSRSNAQRWFRHPLAFRSAKSRRSGFELLVHCSSVEPGPRQPDFLFETSCSFSTCLGPLAATTSALSSKRACRKMPVYSLMGNDSSPFHTEPAQFINSRIVGYPEVRAEQRVVQEGSSPSGARMRGAISKSGGNSSLAEESRRYADA